LLYETKVALLCVYEGMDVGFSRSKRIHSSTFTFMTRPFRSFLMLLALFVLAGLGASRAQTDRILYIRVQLTTQQNISLLFPGAHTTMYTDGTVLNRSESALEWRIAARNSKISIATAQGSFDTGQARLVFETGSDGLFQFAGRAYRGYAYLIAQGSSLTLVNSLPVEQYVQGVLPSEMPSSWPLEALKSQAVIARTYAMSRLNQVGEFDVCATERCQVYGGATVETYAGNEAVAATDGLIVAWNNKPAETYFSADSGGFTASSKEVWGKEIPYLTARPDPDSRWTGTDWTLTPSKSTIATAISRFAPRAGTYRSLRVISRGDSGRILKIEVVGTNATVKLEDKNAYGFARALGAKSSLISVLSTAPLTISGSGNGHGVGLSQWGARGLAARGWTYEQILGYYYVGVSLAGYTVSD
jgi:stage II sporulation protein D